MLNQAVRKAKALPRCSRPVGLGAKRPRGREASGVLSAMIRTCCRSAVKLSALPACCVWRWNTTWKDKWLRAWSGVASKTSLDRAEKGWARLATSPDDTGETGKTARCFPASGSSIVRAFPPSVGTEPCASAQGHSGRASFFRCRRKKARDARLGKPASRVPKKRRRRSRVTERGTGGGASLAVANGRVSRGRHHRFISAIMVCRSFAISSTLCTTCALCCMDWKTPTAI